MSYPGHVEFQASVEIESQFYTVDGAITAADHMHVCNDRQEYPIINGHETQFSAHLRFSHMSGEWEVMRFDSGKLVLSANRVPQAGYVPAVPVTDAVNVKIEVALVRWANLWYRSEHNKALLAAGGINAARRELINLEQRKAELEAELAQVTRSILVEQGNEQYYREQYNSLWLDK